METIGIVSYWLRLGLHRQFLPPKLDFLGDGYRRDHPRPSFHLFTTVQYIASPIRLRQLRGLVKVIFLDPSYLHHKLVNPINEMKSYVRP